VNLQLALEYIARYAKEVGALTALEALALIGRCEKALGEVASTQAKYQESADPVNCYLALLKAVIASGQAHIAATDGKEPDEHPEGWGWREKTIGTGEYQRDEWQPQGRCIGWLEDDQLYLEPKAAYAEVQELARKNGEWLAVSEQTMRKRLNERNLLLTVNERGSELTIQKKIQGKRERVLCMRANTLEPPPLKNP